MATDYWELLCARASASHPTHRFGLRLFSSSFLNEMVLFLRKRDTIYKCQDMEKYTVIYITYVKTLVNFVSYSA